MRPPLPPPELTHADLTSERLEILGALVDEVWTKTKNSHSHVEGDGPWGFGCRFYDRLRSRVRRLSIEMPWLRVIEKSMHFVFTIGAVPIRFYRGAARRPKAGYLARREPERRAQQLAFGAVAQELKFVFRLAIEALYEDARPRVVLVKQEIASGFSEEIFEVPLSSGAPRTVVAPSFRKPPVQIAPPVVSPKRGAKKKRSSDDEGA